MGLTLVAAWLWKSWVIVLFPVTEFIKCQSLFLFRTVPIQWWMWSRRIAEITDDNFIALFKGHLASYWGRLSYISSEWFHPFCANICSVHITGDWFQLRALVTFVREFLHLKMIWSWRTKPSPGFLGLCDCSSNYDVNIFVCIVRLTGDWHAAV